MEAEHQLRQRFEAVADRLRQDIVRHLQQTADELAGVIESERTAAAAASAENARRALEDYQQRLAATRATAELQSDRARDEGWRQGRDAGRLEGVEIGHAQGIEQGREEGRHAERQSAQASRAGLAQAIRAIDGGRSLSEILTTVVGAAAAEHARAALLLVEADRLRWWGSVGLDRPDQMVEAVAASGHGIISDAIRASEPLRVEGDSERRPQMFAAWPPATTLLAVPISLAGQVVAVLYAQRNAGAGADNQDESWVTAVEIATRHASRTLEAMTALRTAQVLSGSGSPSAGPR